MLVSVSLAWAAPPQNYSISYVGKNPDGSYNNSRKYYLRDGNKFRSEYAGLDGVTHTIEILRKDKGLVWSMDPVNKQYREVPLRQDAWDFAIGGPFATADMMVKKTGTVKILNYNCNIYEMLSGEWLNIFAAEPGTNALLRTELKQNGKLVQLTEATEFKTEKPAAALFEVPAGYKKTQ